MNPLVAISSFMTISQLGLGHGFVMATPGALERNDSTTTVVKGFDDCDFIGIL
ncbi:MAG TPA: hypothetical protein VE170_15175 [Candidatus Limnocylindria bacterium]|nr:hypothetical protein [Candidatus Limnocylindria bacterium]